MTLIPCIGIRFRLIDIRILEPAELVSSQLALRNGQGITYLDVIIGSVVLKTCCHDSCTGFLNPYSGEP